MPGWCSVGSHSAASLHSPVALLKVFLVYINDLLSTGYIADLFTPEDKEAFCNAVRSECKAAGILDTMENLWEFFIDKVGQGQATCVGWGGSGHLR